MQKNKGYIALTSVIVVSFVLMSVIFTASIRGFQIRSTIGDYYLKTLSKRVAESCIDIAMLKLADTISYPLYAGNETINIGQDECNIQTIEDLGGNPITKRIRSVSTVGKATTRLEVEINPLNFDIVSWEEVLFF